MKKGVKQENKPLLPKYEIELFKCFNAFTIAILEGNTRKQTAALKKIHKLTNLVAH